MVSHEIVARGKRPLARPGVAAIGPHRATGDEALAPHRPDRHLGKQAALTGPRPFRDLGVGESGKGARARITLRAIAVGPDSGNSIGGVFLADCGRSRGSKSRPCVRRPSASGRRACGTGDGGGIGAAGRSFGTRHNAGADRQVHSGPPATALGVQGGLARRLGHGARRTSGLLPRGTSRALNRARKGRMPQAVVGAAGIGCRVSGLPVRVPMGSGRIAPLAPTGRIGLPAHGPRQSAARAIPENDGPTPAHQLGCWWRAPSLLALCPCTPSGPASCPFC